jgi:hypothetical protein
MPTDDYYTEFAAQEAAQHRAEHEAYLRHAAELRHREPVLHEIIDPTAGGTLTGYALIVARGD